MTTKPQKTARHGRLGLRALVNAAKAWRALTCPTGAIGRVHPPRRGVPGSTVAVFPDLYGDGALRWPLPARKVALARALGMRAYYQPAGRCFHSPHGPPCGRCSNGRLVDRCYRLRPVRGQKAAVVPGNLDPRMRRGEAHGGFFPGW
jgi:hypothetical protein